MLIRDRESEVGSENDFIFVVFYWLFHRDDTEPGLFGREEPATLRNISSFSLAGLHEFHIIIFRTPFWSRREKDVCIYEIHMNQEFLLPTSDR